MTRSKILSRVAAAAISIGIVFNGASVFANETSTVSASWFAAMQQTVAEKLPSSIPVVFKLVGENAFPVFVKALPKYTITITPGADGKSVAASGPMGRALN